jgi:hypothetical protein
MFVLVVLNLKAQYITVRYVVIAGPPLPYNHHHKDSVTNEQDMAV